MLIEKKGKILTLLEFENLVQFSWNQTLDFENEKIIQDLTDRGKKLYKKGELTLEQLWFGKYFKKEILEKDLPDVTIRWIDPLVGWGVFANRNFKKMEFIAEYYGKVRKRNRSDTKNAYCFEYIVAPGFKTPYTIDALDQGGLSRYLNHSTSPNLNSALATIDDISHVIFFTKEPIAKGTQLCYDYGPDYWSKRVAPIPL